MIHQFDLYKLLCTLHGVVALLTFIVGTAVRCGDPVREEKEDETAARKRFGAIMQLTCWTGVVWLVLYCWWAGGWLIKATGRAFKDVIGTRKKPVELTQRE